MITAKLPVSKTEKNLSKIKATITKSLSKIRNDLCRNLLIRMLTVDPEERITLEQVLNHGFFHTRIVDQ